MMGHNKGGNHMEYVLTASSLSKRYRDFKALDQLDLHVEKGAIYGFVGKTGREKPP